MVPFSRRKLSAAALVALVIGLAIAARSLLGFPSDRVPEGAYARIVRALEAGRPQDAFPYLEEDAQVACYTIRDYAHLAAKAIADDYPPERRAAELPNYEALDRAGDPPLVWAHIAASRGWDRRLRRDLSGVTSVETAEDRATVVTARGTRYSFRRRPNGIWGLTMFTAQLQSEAKRLARDWDLVQKSAIDFRAAGNDG